MKKLSVSLTRKEKILGWIYYPIQLLFLPVLIYLVCMLAGIELSLMLENFIYFCANFLGCSLIFFHFLKSVV